MFEFQSLTNYLRNVFRKSQNLIISSFKNLSLLQYPKVEHYLKIVDYLTIFTIFTQSCNFVYKIFQLRKWLLVYNDGYMMVYRNNT